MKSQKDIDNYHELELALFGGVPESLKPQFDHKKDNFQADQRHRFDSSPSEDPATIGYPDKKSLVIETNKVLVWEPETKHLYMQFDDGE